MQFFGQPFDRERRVGVHSPVAFRIGAPRRLDNRRRGVELGHQAVMTRSAPIQDLASSSLTSACGNSSRTSKMEIAGRRRTNRNISATKKPIVPVKIT